MCNGCDCGLNLGNEVVEAGQFFMAAKQVRGIEMTRGEYNIYRGWTIPIDENPSDEGYLVRYKGGYESWCPKDEMLKYNIPMGGDGSKVNLEMVEGFIKENHISTIGPKTTMVRTVLKNGFEIIETSACVDLANYDESLGASICMNKIKDRIWYLLGFMLASARNGVKA